ncbi:MAG: flavodoxin family protein [Desulfobacterota bacterium]|nr:flavodoxin family protein [Thermodesulfobacteriota bacterium]
MKVIALNGSARGKKGVTWRLMEALLKGLSEAGASVTDFQLKEMNLSPCRACLTCMHKTPGQCAQRDDMDQIYPHLKASDLFVMGTPVYTDNMSAQMKTVMDRCICGMDPFLTRDASGRVRHPYSWRLPSKFLLLSTSGFPETDNFGPLVLTFRAQAANFGCEPIGEICIPGSIALQMVPQLLEPRLELIRQAGNKLALEGKIPSSLLEDLNQPIVNVDQYLEIAARYEAWARKSRGEEKA